MDKSQLSYRYSAYGYMLTYKGKNLGGCGTQTNRKMHWQHARQNLQMYKESAERDIERIKSGEGDIRYLEVIERIDKEGE